MAQLAELKRLGRVASVVIREHLEAFPTDESKTAFFDQLSEFSMCHHVRLGRVFGSNKHHFGWFPAAFLLLRNDTELLEVFPHDTEDRRIEPEEFLERFIAGEPWATLGESKRKSETNHQQLLAMIRARPDLLEPGMRLVRTDVHVSRNFGEVGYIDAVLQDKDSRYMLLEVKVRPEEIDKAIGQVLRQKELFCSQNFVDPIAVRVGIACPYVPELARRVCSGHGIELFELGSGV
jgi:hypothetical protein